MGLLADALYATGVSFPIAQMGEELDDIDPFTFLASFNRQIPEFSRQRLVADINSRLDIRLNGEVDFAGAPDLPLYKLRFFSNRHSQCREIELLWQLLALLRVLDSDDSGWDKSSGEAIRQVVKEYAMLNAAGKEKLQWAFYWVCPRYHQQLIEIVGAGVYPTEEFASALKYAAKQKLPMVNRQAFNAILTKYAKDERLASEHDGRDARQLEKWLTVKRFSESFDIDAEDFVEMLSEALGSTNSLVENTNNFYPYSEITRLAKLEPESVRAAFGELFSKNVNLPARVLHFCNTITILHERYRDRFARWQIKPCAHANYYVASIYLFMYDPCRYFLYSPARAQRLSAAVGYKEIFRPTDADVVEAYAEMCRKLIECLVEHPLIIERVKKPLETRSGFADTNNHLLLDDIIVTSFSI